MLQKKSPATESVIETESASDHWHTILWVFLVLFFSQLRETGNSSPYVWHEVILLKIMQNPQNPFFLTQGTNP